MRKIIYTTNAIESLHMQIRKVLKIRGHFPVTKLIYWCYEMGNPFDKRWQLASLRSNLAKGLTESPRPKALSKSRVASNVLNNPNRVIHNRPG
ncbi:MAG: transposase [Verrucomicrobia bacterium]|nr:transposase [Verrucomicrobiota bacterium]